MRNTDRKLLLAMLIGFVIGTLWLVSARFLMVKNDEVHYHANFAVYIDGQRYPFDGFTYYEEVQSCSGDEVTNPKTRVHMHDNVNHVVHVHDEAATWGHLFANLGLVLGNDILRMEDKTYIDGENDKTLSFVLNGNPIGAVANRTIESQDVLLISYGDADDSKLRDQYGSIVKDAADYNQRADPSACSGGQPLTFAERLKRAIGF